MYFGHCNPPWTRIPNQALLHDMAWGSISSIMEHIWEADHWQNPTFSWPGDPSLPNTSLTVDAGGRRRAKAPGATSLLNILRSIAYEVLGIKYLFAYVRNTLSWAYTDTAIDMSNPKRQKGY